MPASKEKQRRHARDRYHVGVFRHKEAGEFHAAVLCVEASDQFIFGFGKIEWNAVGLGEGRNHENDEAENLRERHLENVPARYETQIIAGLAVCDSAKTEMVRE